MTHTISAADQMCPTVDEVTDTEGCVWYRDEESFDAWYCQGFEGMRPVTLAQLLDLFGPLTPVAERG